MKIFHLTDSNIDDVLGMIQSLRPDQATNIYDNMLRREYDVIPRGQVVQEFDQNNIPDIVTVDERTAFAIGLALYERMNNIVPEHDFEHAIA